MTSSELEYKQNTFGNWDKIGVRFFSKGWSVDIESKCIGLLIRWFRVRASGYPFSQTSQSAGFSSFYSEHQIITE
jgi:hypothetical protein